MTLGQKIKWYRQLRGYTQEQLAKKIGVGRLHITKLEKDLEWPSLMCLLQIAHALDMAQTKECLRHILGGKV